MHFEIDIFGENRYFGRDTTIDSLKNLEKEWIARVVFFFCHLPTSNSAYSSKVPLTIHYTGITLHRPSYAQVRSQSCIGVLTTLSHTNIQQ